MPALSAVRNRAHIYSFNIPENTLKKAYDLLDKEPNRPSLKFSEIISRKDLMADFITLEQLSVSVTTLSLDTCLV